MTRRTREEAQWAPCFKCEGEEADLDSFIHAYRRATGFQLSHYERPHDNGTQDFVCQRSDGLVVGIEPTQIRRAQLIGGAIGFAALFSS